MRRHSPELTGAVVAACLCVATLMLPEGSPPRLLIGALLALVLPGIALMRALRLDRGVADQVLLTLAGSVACIIGLGVGLQVTPVRLSAAAWAIAATVLSASLLRYAHAKRPPVGRSPRRLPRLRIRDAVLASLALAVLVAAVAVGTTPLPAPADTPMQTALWAVPDPDEPRDVSVGVRSGERRPGRFRLAVSVDGKVVVGPAILRLAPGERYATKVVAPPGAARVEARMTPLDEPGAADRRAAVVVRPGGLARP